MPVTRPPIKRSEIVERLREMIVTGKLGAGERLPTRIEIEETFDASTHTVQRALDQLIADGFVVAKGRQGTFVADAPPHLYSYALAIPLCRHDPGFVRFWKVLEDVAGTINSEGSVRIDTFVGIDPQIDESDYKSLLARVNSRRLAGIIFASNPFLVEKTELMQAPALPRVAFVGPAGRDDVAGITLGGGGESFFRRALDYLQAHGRTRIGLITVPGIKKETIDAFALDICERGLTYRPWWIQTAHQANPSWAGNLARLMLCGSSQERPDALIIADDNLVEHTCAGIAQAGVKVPAELDVVAHCNFPAPAPAILPTARLGYDITQIMRTCLSLLEAQRQNRTVPTLTQVQPVFESELPQSHNQPIESIQKVLHG